MRSEPHAADKMKRLCASCVTGVPNSVTLKVSAPAFKTASLSKNALRSSATLVEVSDAVCGRRLKVSTTAVRFSSRGSCGSPGRVPIASPIYQTRQSPQVTAFDMGDEIHLLIDRRSKRVC